jgi:hypothetical protein
MPRATLTTSGPVSSTWLVASLAIASPQSACGVRSRYSQCSSTNDASVSASSVGVVVTSGVDRVSTVASATTSR